MPESDLPPEAVPQPGEGPAPHPAPIPGVDRRLDDDGDPGPSAQRRLAESFGISLLPLLVVLLVRLISWSGNPLNPVDLSLAMLSTAAVVVVQIQQRSRENPTLDVVPRLVWLMLFVASFAVVAAVGSRAQSEADGNLTSAAAVAVTDLGSADTYITAHQAPAAQASGLPADLANDEKALKDDSRSAADSEDMPGPLLGALLVTLVFLIYLYKFAWREP